MQGQFDTPTQRETTLTPPGRCFLIELCGQPGRDFQARDAWEALATVFPGDYPSYVWYGSSPAHYKVHEVTKSGRAVVKTGIGSRDIAESLVAKLVRFNVPESAWRIAE